MKQVMLVLVLMAAVCMGLRLATGPEGLHAERVERGSAKASLQITAHVDAFAEWADPAPVIFEADWSGPINHVNQQRIATRHVILYSNTDVVITPHADLNKGILTQGSATLETAYKLSGAVATADERFKPAREFFDTQNNYRLIHMPGTGAYTIDLQVQMSSPPGGAPEEGVYTCGMTLTAVW